jgi:uncharacterized membrane protein
MYFSLPSNGDLLTRLESGQWVRWRFGRRRLAWRPGSSALELLQFAEGLLTIFVAMAALGWWLLSWAGLAVSRSGVAMRTIRGNGR